MSWTRNITDKIADYMRFFVRGTLLIALGAFAIATTYLSIMLAFRLAQFIHRTVLAHPW